MTAVCETFGVALSSIAERVRQRHSRARGRPPRADQELMDEITTIIDDMPTYGYRRVHAFLSRKARSENRPWPNAKRVYPVGSRHASSEPHRCNQYRSPRWLRRRRIIQSPLMFRSLRNRLRQQGVRPCRIRFRLL